MKYKHKILKIWTEITKRDLPPLYCRNVVSVSAKIRFDDGCNTPWVVEATKEYLLSEFQKISRKSIHDDLVSEGIKNLQHLLVKESLITEISARLMKLEGKEGEIEIGA